MGVILDKSLKLTQKHLELCRRLGIRYLLPHPLEGDSGSMEPPPVSPALVYNPVPEITGPRVEEKFADETPGSIPLNRSSGKSTDAPEHRAWLTGRADSLHAMELIAFQQDTRECQNCPLGKTRKNFVFGSGNPQAEVVFVGEAPGAEEDAQGLPFVGQAGQLLTKIIESTKTWKRVDVFICNVLKCRPPGNRPPLPEEVEKCLPYLEEQIRILKPKLIMALGASAAQSMLGTKDSVGRLRNKWHDFRGIPLRVTYHPAALLRFDGYKKDVWEDMKEFTTKYQQIQGK
jgi:DNA polymerase